MKKKLLSILLIGILIIGITGCGKSFESKILNKEFSHDITGYNDNLVSTEIFIFKGNGKGIVKNIYPESSKNRETEITYVLDEDNKEVTVHYENGKNSTFKYDEENDCMVGSNQYCNK